MKQRSGYNIIELLIAITAIALITAIGYKGVNVLFDSIKVEGVKTEISKVKVALAKAQAAGSIYWGGKFAGTTREEMKKINPNPLATGTSGGCNYYSYSGSSASDFCTYENVINAEQELYKKMLEMEFKFTDGTFRSSRFPTSSIGFTHNINGYSGIVFSDLPGNIAKKLYEELNTPKWTPKKDGLSSDRPILIFAASSSIGSIDELPDVTNGFEGLLDPVKGLTEALNKNTDGGLEYIGTQPKVTLIFMYTYKKSSW